MNKEKTKNNNNKVVLKWMLKRARRFIPGIAAICIFNIISALSFVWLAILSGNVLNATTENILIKFAFCLFGTIILQIITTSLLSIFNIHVSGKLTMSLRNYLFSTLVRKKYANISQIHSGELLNRFTSDIDVVVSGCVNILPSLASMLTKIIAGAGTLLIMSPTLTAIVVSMGFLFPMLGRFISKKYRYMHKEVQESEGQARSFLQESFSNIVVIKSFVSEAPFLHKLKEFMQKNFKAKLRRNHVSLFSHICLYSFFTIGYYGVLVWGATQITAGVIQYGTLNTLLQLISQLRAPLQNVSGILPQYYSALASAERLMDIENTESEPSPLNGEAIEDIKNNFEKISVNNVAFAYDNEIILEKCTFEIEKNKITAITGESGSGKSTLFKLILGLYEPTGGKITINSDTPIDASTRALFAYVPQGNMILSGTIRENITMCNPDISEEQIISAAKTAVIYDFIKTLPDGFDTVLSERGAGLSEGQIQRISIARAILSDAPILLLDEATSALDEPTETTLLSNIKELSDKTVLFITHRHTSVSVCDRIIYVENKKFSTTK